jgi:hypothetical protein
MKHQVVAAAPWRPAAYIAVEDHACRARIADTLQRLGWLPVEQPSGFHILCELSDAIEKEASVTHVGMIVVDEISRGCSGATLAKGLRDLGCSIPIVLVRNEWSTPPRESYGTAVHVVDRAFAASTIGELVRPWSPSTLTQPTASRERAMA